MKEDLIQRIGLAYIFHCLFCEEKDVDPMSPSEFTEYSLTKINEIRDCIE